MRRLRAAVAWWEDFASPVMDPIERAMLWLKAKWWRLAIGCAIEAIVIGLLVWLT